MKYVCTLILCFLMTEKSAEMSFLSEKETSPTAECIIQILNKYFNGSKKIFIKYSDQSSIVSEIMRRTSLPIIVNADEIQQTFEIDNRTPDDVSVIMDESINMSQILNERKWTPSTQYLVIITKSRSSEEKMIDIFRKFWVNNIVNVLLLIADKSEVHIYTFIPFNQYDCAIHKPVILATWTPGGITTDKEINQKERVTNLNGCILNATVLNSPPSIIFPSKESRKGTKFVNGIEGLILEEISNRLNFKLNLAEPKDGKDWGWVKPKPKGAVGDVYLKKSHFACGNFAYKPERFKYLDMSTSICCDIECISWAVPLGAKKALPGWISLLTTGFSTTVWYLIAAIFILAAVTFRILSKVSATDQHLLAGNIGTILYTFRSSLYASVKEPESSPLKFFFSTWLWYCFIIATAYQALIGSKLTVPQRQADINTFKDLLESDLQIMGFRNMFQLATEAQEEDKQLKAIGNRSIESNYSFNEVIGKLIHDRSIAYVGTMTTFKYNALINPKAKGLIHFMKDCVRKYYPVMLLQKNCPFTFRVNQVIRSLFESGIICKWRRKFIYDVSQPEPSVEKLSRDRMRGSFVALGLGQAAAFIVFLAEHAFYRYSLRKDACKTDNEKNQD